MFGKASNKQNLFVNSGSITFKNRIAPKIAAYIQKPINVRVAGENACLNAWLIKNLSSISALHITLASQRPGKRYQKKAKYE